MSPKKDTRKTTGRGAPSARASGGFSAEERAAMNERAREPKAEARRGPHAGHADGEREVLARIRELVRRAVG